MSGAWWALVVIGGVAVFGGIALFFAGALMEGGIIGSGSLRGYQPTGAGAGTVSDIGATLKAIVKAFVAILGKSWKIIFSNRKTIRPGQRLEAAGALLTVIGLLYLLGVAVAAAIASGGDSGGTTTGGTSSTAPTTTATSTP
jgi:hypothetical protein